MEEHEIFAFIPARGGSKRIPRKNIKMLAGKPMMAWTIEACKKSKYITRTFVSTEDAEVKNIALSYGAEVVDRPAEFSGDDISPQFAMDHWRYWLWKNEGFVGTALTEVAFLLPTCPMITEKHIDGAMERYLKSKSNVLITICKTPIVPADGYFINDRGLAERVLDRQDVWKFNDAHVRKEKEDIIYYPNGVALICPYFLFVNNIGSGSFCPDYYIMEQEDSIDVNTPLDFKIAELLLEERIKGGGKND